MLVPYNEGIQWFSFVVGHFASFIPKERGKRKGSQINILYVKLSWLVHLSMKTPNEGIKHLMQAFPLICHPSVVNAATFVSVVVYHYSLDGSNSCVSCILVAALRGLLPAATVLRVLVEIKL